MKVYENKDRTQFTEKTSTIIYPEKGDSLKLWNEDNVVLCKAKTNPEETQVQN